MHKALPLAPTALPHLLRRICATCKFPLFNLILDREGGSSTESVLLFFTYLKNEYARKKTQTTYRPWQPNGYRLIVWFSLCMPFAKVYRLAFTAVQCGLWHTCHMDKMQVVTVNGRCLPVKRQLGRDINGARHTKLQGVCSLHTHCTSTNMFC